MMKLLTTALLALVAASVAAAPPPQLTDAERQKAEAVPVAANFAAAKWGSVARQSPKTGDKQDGRRLPALNDGKASTAAPARVGSPVTVQFDTALLVCRTRLLLAPDMAGRISYRVEVSENRRDWKTVTKPTNVAARPIQSDTFRPAFARAIRLTITSCDAPAKLMLREVEVYGTAGDVKRHGAGE